jgi:hypothetical protein
MNAVNQISGNLLGCLMLHLIINRGIRVDIYADHLYVFNVYDLNNNQWSNLYSGFVWFRVRPSYGFWCI